MASPFFGLQRLSLSPSCRIPKLHAVKGKQMRNVEKQIYVGTALVPHFMSNSERDGKTVVFV